MDDHLQKQYMGMLLISPFLCNKYRINGVPICDYTRIQHMIVQFLCNKYRINGVPICDHTWMQHMIVPFLCNKYRINGASIYDLFRHVVPVLVYIQLLVLFKKYRDLNISYYCLMSCNFAAQCYSY